MGLTIDREDVSMEVAMEMFELDGTYHVDANQNKIVPNDSQEAAFLLGIKGRKIPMHHAVSLGLVKKVEDKEVEKVEDKEVKKGKK